MPAITLSSKYQIVIPREARERLGWKPGQKLQVIAMGGQAHLVPVVPMAEARGMFAPMDTDIEREQDREF